MSTSPVFVLDKKNSNRIYTGPQPSTGSNVFSINDDANALGINRFKYFKCGTSPITVGSWVAINIATDLRTIVPALNAITLNVCVGVAVEGATAAEATAGKMLKVQVAGYYKDAQVATGGSAGHWVCLHSSTPGLGISVDPTNIITSIGTEAEVEAGLRLVGDRIGVLLEAAAGGLASVWIIPKL